VGKNVNALTVLLYSYPTALPKLSFVAHIAVNKTVIWSCSHYRYLIKTLQFFTIALLQNL